MESFCLHIPTFIITFALGLLYVYIATPHRKVIVRYPTPDNAGKVRYADMDGNCFVLDKENVACTFRSNASGNDGKK
jgi:hypothetical protein